MCSAQVDLGSCSRTYCLYVVIDLLPYLILAGAVALWHFLTTCPSFSHVLLGHEYRSDHLFSTPSRRISGGEMLDAPPAPWRYYSQTARRNMPISCHFSVTVMAPYGSSPMEFTGYQHYRISTTNAQDNNSQGRSDTLKGKLTTHSGHPGHVGLACPCIASPTTHIHLCPPFSGPGRSRLHSPRSAYGFKRRAYANDKSHDHLLVGLGVESFSIGQSLLYSPVGLPRTRMMPLYRK
ncbi:hypothetical protein CC1G_13850 [Coprinopsis cinerea okayama7|uniref:Uncharacterized protein n=1 Tax=Coprinopsis cinerea (strain Okayama-7 / 130 / ATCC MYA-4618 / FGSC 9003) TaxID=240176 RepID=D6RKL2_COPC7|nr:hypothetical protein CC1G_13850 [Coprinopsis cinerea okayama7\|eukprot:XP_002911815.1 hypothetical protein CC1G_13850 [Coprinopsis cinerea okayama7\